MKNNSKTQLHWNYFLAIENELKILTRYIEFDESNYNTNSIELSKLLMALGSEIDVVLKLICKDIFGITKSNIKGYLEILQENIPEIFIESFFINQYNLQFTPFKDCTSENTPFWWNSYNKVKHHRYENFAKANLENVLNAAGALLIANVYYYSLLNKHEEDLNIKMHINNLSPQSTLISLNPEYYIKIMGAFLK